MSGESVVTAAETMAKTGEHYSSGEIDQKDAEATNMESRILSAMRSRVAYLREKADSFTFESVRRLLEEDLGLDKHALDVHKSFVKQHLVQCLESAGNDGASENSQEFEKKESPKDDEAKKNLKEDTGGDKEIMEDSPVMGLLAAEKTSNSVAEETKEEGKKEVHQTEIKKALRKRASYIRANSEKITMALLRRLLEKDLRLEKYALDPYKNFINEELDEVLHATDASKASTEAKGKNLKKKVENIVPKKVISEERESDGEEDDEEEEVGVRKKAGPKRKIEEARKRKHEKEKAVPMKKKSKPTETDSRSDSDGADSEIVSDDGRSQSSSEKPSKKKEVTAAVYGTRVERLKSAIKSCGMSAPPSIYRKAKQAPEEKREAALIKELEQILAKEGLSSNPSEKEIKEVRKRKERAKELEGIDTSNIVSSSRRRSTTSFVPPPKPKITEESESDESEDSEDEEQEEQEEGNGDAGEESHSGGESNNEEDGDEDSE